jgi:hypothetical protein
MVIQSDNPIFVIFNLIVLPMSNDRQNPFLSKLKNEKTVQPTQPQELQLFKVRRPASSNLDQFHSNLKKAHSTLFTETRNDLPNTSKALKIIQCCAFINQNENSCATVLH